MATVRRNYTVKFSVLTSLPSTGILFFFLITRLQSVTVGISHGESCNAIIACQFGLICQKDKCWCPDKNYYDSKTQKCESEDKVKVSNLKWNSTTDSFICELSQNDSLSIIYEVSVNASSPQQNFSQGRAQITNLSPGMYYAATITARVDLYKTVTSVSFWTKPAKPGLVISVNVTKRPDAQSKLYMYNIIFGASKGNVKKYELQIGNNETYELKKTTVNVSLRPSTTYDYSITSYNGNNDASEVSKGSFTTKSEKSSNVRNLTVNQEPCSTNIIWRQPEYPKGIISHYQLNLMAVYTNGTCGWRCTPSAQCTPFAVSGSDSNQGSNVNCSTENFLSSKDEEFSIRLLGLEPSNTYNVTIAAVNDAGTGVAESNKFVTQIAADDVRNIKLSSVRNSDSNGTGKIQLKITWDPSPSQGNISYNVEIRKARDHNSNDFVTDQSVTGIIGTEKDFDDVSAYWKYTAHIQAVSCKGKSNVVSSNPHTTVENNPGKVQNLSVEQSDREATNVIITFNCLETTELNGNIINYTIKQTVLNGIQEKPQLHTVSPINCNHRNTLKALEVGKQYEFAVQANNRYNGLYSEPKNLTAQPKKPLLSEKYPRVDVLIKPKSDGANINVEVCTLCIRDPSQGNVVNSGLIVCVFGDQNNCQNLDSEFKNFITWKEAGKIGFTKPYRTTSNNWTNNMKSLNDNYTTFEVGVDSNCDTSSEKDFCNGPLPGGKEIFISVVVCTNAGCDSLQAGKVYVAERPEQPNNTAAIALSILAILIVICIIVVLVIRRLLPWRSQWLLKKQADNEAGIPEKRPVKMRDFEEHLKKLHKDSDLLLQSEFEDIKRICMTFKNSHIEAQREANRVKNRFVDILPYDHSRVKLNVQPDGDETNDFINANYIPGFNSVREYIATQGPMNCTIPDFWCMIWEQKCQIIVMVSDLQENGKLKVDQYWPENLHESVTFENVVVEMTNFSQLNKYIIRSFKISKGAETRKVTQYFLPGWCDFSANLSFSDVLELAKLMRQEITPDSSGPITVHCSAGVGRTGTFIAIDYFRQYVDQHTLDDDVDIYEYVLRMRRNRPRMVQAESQYIFIYDTVQEMIKKKMEMEKERLNDELKSDGNANLTQRNEGENNYVEIQLNDEKCVYINDGFESDNSNIDAEKAVLKTTIEP